MIPAESLLVFFAASALLALAPGPDNIFVLTLSALHGPRAGWIVTLGLCTGLVGHTIAVAVGIAAVFQASELAFTALKIAGACYLLYLAWGAFRASAEKLEAQATQSLGAGQLYRRGIVMNLTNPKVSIFFLAFLPQFADPARGSLSLQLVLLGGVFIVAALVVFGSIAALAGSLGRWLNRSSRAQVVMNRVAGTIFVALAVKLALTQR
ncbi:MAG TPA: LysE family translocator [Burkholderiales bacterium]|nr:LysE family translocator [Burkholderiales bacterium]